LLRLISDKCSPNGQNIILPGTGSTKAKRHIASPKELCRAFVQIVVRRSKFDLKQRRELFQLQFQTPAASLL
jgi:hypothetical protein